MSARKLLLIANNMCTGCIYIHSVMQHWDNGCNFLYILLAYPLLDKNNITVKKYHRPTLFLLYITKRSSLFKSWWHRKKICRYDGKKTGMNTPSHKHLLLPYPPPDGVSWQEHITSMVTQTWQSVYDFVNTLTHLSQSSALHQTQGLVL